jgi:hypothetical protein
MPRMADGSFNPRLVMTGVDICSLCKKVRPCKVVIKQGLKTKLCKECEVKS